MGVDVFFAAADFNVISVSMTALITTLIGGLSGVIAFLLTPSIRRWFRGPNLKLEFDQNRPCVAEYPDAKYIKVKVTNRGRAAVKCRAYLASVKAIKTPTVQPEYPYWDYLRLIWSWSALAVKGQRLFPDDMTIPSGIRAYVDVAKAEKGKPASPQDTAILCTEPRLDEYKEMIIPGNTYHVEVVVTSENAVPKKIKLQLSWDGKFSSLFAEPVAPCSKA
jgi:hypothetical protein